MLGPIRMQADPSSDALQGISGPSYYRARYYDATTGRFMSEDPARLRAGSMNFYRYVRNNPARLNDPFGLFTIGATINFNLQLGPVTIVGSAGVALDNHGNFGITLDPGGGVGVGVNSSVTQYLLPRQQSDL